MLPPAQASPPLTEQILKCDGRITINCIMHVVKEVTTVLGPKDACNYAPVEPIHARARLGAASGSRDTGTRAESAGGRPARAAGGDGRHGKAVQSQDGDETLTCRACNREFCFPVGEQEFYKAQT